MMLFVGHLLDINRYIYMMKAQTAAREREIERLKSLGEWPPKEPEKQQNAPARKNGKQPAAKKDAKPEKASGNVSKQKQPAGGKKTLTVKPASDIQGPNL